VPLPHDELTRTDAWVLPGLGGDPASVGELQDMALVCEEALKDVHRSATPAVGVAGLAALGAAGPALVNQWLLSADHPAVAATAASLGGETEEVAAEAVHVEYTVHDAPDHGAHAAAGPGPAPALAAAEWKSLFAPPTAGDSSTDTAPVRTTARPNSAHRLKPRMR
jgi:hypothetical protein